MGREDLKISKNKNKKKTFIDKTSKNNQETETL